MRRVLLTGFPGLLGSELARRLLRRSEPTAVVCLVQAKFAEPAQRRAAEIAAAEAVDPARIELVEGDLARERLGLGREARAAREIDELFHLAAVYDLAVRRELALAVNVEGTRRVLEFARAVGRPVRVQYVSTCYVSGRYPGIFRERDLERGQTFNNAYEESKYLAEVEVRRAIAEGLAATVYRPGIVVGDSRTGATQKYDGPYPILRWLLKQPTVAVLPVPSDVDRLRANLVPRDFVVDAIAALSELPSAAGVTYQLADPDPPTIDETIGAMGEATGRIVARVPLPVGLAKAAIDWVPGVERVMGIPSATIDYFTHPTFYDTANADRDLGAAGVRCPRLVDYLPRLVEFVKQHPEIPAEAMA
jgi:thioester reductase-like protein